MIKYRNKGNLPQNADYYALLNRSDADWRDSVRQGLVAKTGGAATDKITYTGFELTKATSFELSIDIHNMGEQSGGGTGNIQTLWSTAAGTQYIGLREIAGGLVFYDGVNAAIVFAVDNMATGAFLNIKFSKPANSNTVTATVYNYVAGTTRTANATLAGDFTAFTIARLGSRGINDRPLRSGFSNEKITLNGTCIANRPYCGDTKDICPLGNHGTISGTVSLAERSNYSTFRNDEYPFAVKSGATFPMKIDGSGYAGLVGEPDKIYYPGPYPNTFTGNWHELTHAYFDKSNTDIWEDFIRESINYISEEPTYWNVDEISQDYFDKYVKAAYRDKIYCGLGAEDDDYRGAVMVFESGVPAAPLSELTFWRKRKGFPVDRRVAWVDIDTPITLTAGASGTITGRGYFVGQHIEVEVRLSGETPEDAWTPFGTATVAGDGSWTVSGTIASADTYDFRVIDENIDPAVCFAQVDDVAVASGTLLVENWDSYVGNTGVWTGSAGQYTLYSTKYYTSPNCCRLNLSLTADRYIDSNNLLASTIDMTGKSVKFRALRWDSRSYAINFEVWLYNGVGTLVGKSTRKTNQAVSDSVWNLIDSGTFTAQPGQVITAVKMIQIYVRSYAAYELPLLIDDIIIE